MAHVQLAEVLRKKKISKRKFAKLLKTDSGTIRRYFKPNFNPTLATLERFAKVLGVKIRDLIKE
jgi:transcriptional regulator with XRE-family HTH domain